MGMQFVVRGRLEGQQGTRLQPAMMAVTVAFVTGMTLTVNPAFSLRGEAGYASPKMPAMHAGALTIPGSPPTGSGVELSERQPPKFVPVHPVFAKAEQSPPVA